MLKLYGDFSKQDWLDILKLEEKEVPGTFILHGEWEHAWNLEKWREILAGSCKETHWNTVIGRYEKRQVGFANVFGGPMAGSIAHQFAAAGTEQFIQTGYFGGLSNKVDYGDILIVTAAEMQDGVSHWYLPGERIVKADEVLVREAIRYCEEKGYTYVTGSVITTSSLMTETYDMVTGWSARGHIGVDMETAATFAVAEKFTKKAIGFLNLSDHLLKGEHLYNNQELREEVEEETDERIRELALHLAQLS
ncbi:uridine phosphorylase [Bacillus marinisedimentorum]|uniref:phosphorylase family protein n=1 Tax=Bacillus marinisedimentorum TaxID=1821260 RepID=UPI000AA4EC05|nr:uridine phosphorylase [Bacillus marinisedimentorum]